MQRQSYLKSQSGLFCQLISLEFEANISPPFADVELVQTYHNTTGDVIKEAEYCLPLDAESAVYKWEVTTAQGHFVGRLKEKVEAEKDYQDAKETNHPAVLVVDRGRDEIVIRIANLDVNSQVIVKARYASFLQLEGISNVRFIIPTYLAPRYKEARSSNEQRIEDGQQTKIHARVNFRQGSVHALRASNNGLVIIGENPRVEFEQRGDLERDVVVVAELTNPHIPRAETARLPDGRHAISFSVVHHVPQIETSQPLCVAIVVDLSGSMSGGRDKMALDAVTGLLASLRLGDCFNLLFFGSTCHPVFQTAVEYNDATKRQAQIAVNERLQMGGLGGTEMFQALKQAVQSMATCPVSRKIILLLTDGQCERKEESAILKLLQNVATFALGIGDGISRDFLLQVARQSGGYTRFVSHMEDTAHATGALIAAAQAGAWKDVVIQCPGWNSDPDTSSALPSMKLPSIISSPPQLPWLCHLTPFRAILLLQPSPGHEDGPSQLKLLGTDTNNSIQEMIVPVVKSVSPQGLSALIARSFVNDCERGLVPTLDPLAVRGFAVANAVFCSYTAFVAVDDTQTILPNSYTKPQKDIYTNTNGSRKCEMEAQIELLRIEKSFEDARRKLGVVRAAKYTSAAPATPTPAPTPSEYKLMIEILAQQAADGSWSIDSELIRRIFPPEQIINQVVVIQSIVKWFEVHCQAWRNVWELPARKALSLIA